MAIQQRRGDEADFLPGKMLPGEFAVSMDKKYLYLCFSSGVVKRVALLEDIAQEIATLEESLTGQIETLAQSGSEALTRIINLESRANTDEGSIRDNATAIAALQGRATSAETGLSNLAAGIQTLQGRADTIEAKDRQQDSDIATNTSNISSLANRINTMEQKDVHWSFAINSAGHLIETVERYDAENTRFFLEEGRLKVTYG